MCLALQLFSFATAPCVGLVLSFFFRWLPFGILFLVFFRLDFSFLLFFFAFFGYVAVPVEEIPMFCFLVFDIFCAVDFSPSCVFPVCCLASSVLFRGLVPGGVGALSAVPLPLSVVGFLRF